MNRGISMGKTVYCGLQWFLGLFAAYIFFLSGSDRYFLGPVALLFFAHPPRSGKDVWNEVRLPFKNYRASI